MSDSKITHDKQWIYRTFGDYYEGPCTQYHEHMQRWRSLDELPEHGQRIEVACHYPGMELISEIDDFDAHTSSLAKKWALVDADQTPIAWRPAGPLPEATRITRSQSESSD